MLAAALRRNRSHCTFHDLEQGLLHAFTRNVAGDRRIVRFARDLVDLVDIDNPALSLVDIVVGRLQQLENDVFDILAHITGFGQRCGVRHRERHVENARQRLGQQRLAATGRTDQKDIGLGKLNILVLGRMVQALVVVVHGHRKHALGAPLADNVIVEHFADIGRARHAICGLDHRGFRFLADDVHAQLNAFITDEYGGSGDQLADFVLGFPAERAVQRVLGGFSARIFLGHLATPEALQTLGSVSPIHNATRRRVNNFSL